VDTAVAKSFSSAASAGWKKTCRCTGADSDAAPSTFAPNNSGDGGTAPVSLTNWLEKAGARPWLVGVAPAGAGMAAGNPMAPAARANAAAPVQATRARPLNWAAPDLRRSMKSLC
jgi:hypothetical protein